MLRPIILQMTLAPFIRLRQSPTRSIARAAYKFAGSVVRRFKLIPEAANWPQRAEVCERCPMRVIQCGVSYCGKPFAKMPIRDLIADGCGCPTRAKAKDPKEHCPLNVRYGAAAHDAARCDCKWCRLAVRANDK